MAEPDVHQPDVGVVDGKFTARAKGKVIGEVNINVGPNGTTIEFTTDFDEGAIYRDVQEEYKSDKYTFLPKKGSNPEVKFNKDGYSVIKFSLVEIKK